MREEGFNPTQDFVRVGVKSGGCSGLSYDLSFDNSKSDQDRLFEDNQVKILVDKKSLLYLLGTTLEYSGGLNLMMILQTMEDKLQVWRKELRDAKS